MLTNRPIAVNSIDIEYKSAYDCLLCDSQLGWLAQTPPVHNIAPTSTTYRAGYSSANPNLHPSEVVGFNMGGHVSQMMTRIWPISI